MTRELGAYSGSNTQMLVAINRSAIQYFMLIVILEKFGGIRDQVLTASTLGVGDDPGMWGFVSCLNPAPSFFIIANH